MAQPTINFYSNRDQIWSNGGKLKKYSIHLFSMIDYRKKYVVSSKSLFRIDYAVGTALFIRRCILKKIGLLDNYFLYYEDPDLCYRARLNGFENVYCISEARIFHNTKLEFSNNFKIYYFRSRMIFCLKFLDFKTLIWQFFIQFFKLFLYSINFKNFRIDYDLLFKSLKGILLGLQIGIRKRLER